MQLKTETKVGLFVLVSIFLFAYAAMYLGVFSFYLRNYQPYYIYFDDINGLAKKADIKISGVKVGWVDQIELEGNQAKIKAMILAQYKLYSDAYADIRQEGFLGPKFLEIVPGSSSTKILFSGATLEKSGKPKVAVDDLMHRFEKIAQNIEDVSASLRNVFASSDQQDQLKSIISNMDKASSKIAVFSDVLARNDRNIDVMLSNFSLFSGDIRKLTDRLDSDIFPSFRASIERISEVFDRDFNRVAGRLDSTMSEIGGVAEKINNGKGFLGRLVNDNDVYDDIRVIANGFREATDFAENLGLVIDSHVEAMQRPAEHYEFEDSKGYIDVRFHTREDLFYLFQVMGSEKGSINRTRTFTDYSNNEGRPFSFEDLSALPPSFYVELPVTHKLTNTRNTTKYGFQIGKMYTNFALRFGLFENTVGGAVDYEFPFCSDNFRWISSFEVFDCRGQDRINDRRPHLKWINRVYLLKNIYFDFGADDFVSKHNASSFVGLGFKFTDDDLKLILSRFGGLFNAMSVQN